MCVVVAFVVIPALFVVDVLRKASNQAGLSAVFVLWRGGLSAFAGYT